MLQGNLSSINVREYNVNIQNATINNGVLIRATACNNITTNNSVIVKQGGRLELEAGADGSAKSVKINNGFKIESGGSFIIR